MASTVEEAVSVLSEAGLGFEIIAVDDGSTDRTAAILRELRARLASLRVVSLAPNAGQSAAFGAGIRSARGATIVLMDGDGQNDPRDVPAMLRELEGCDVVCGHRTHRKDRWSKRVGSRLARAVREAVLQDGALDTGCSLKVIRGEFARDLPLGLRGMHRFLPALLQMRGARMKQMPVNHRPRRAGRSKYTNLGRLFASLADLLSVRWMQKRHCNFHMKELT